MAIKKEIDRKKQVKTLSQKKKAEDQLRQQREIQKVIKQINKQATFVQSDAALKNLPNSEKEDEFINLGQHNKEATFLNDLNTDRDISPMSRGSKDEDNIARHTLP